MPRDPPTFHIDTNVYTQVSVPESWTNATSTFSSTGPVIMWCNPEVSFNITIWVL